MVFSACLHIFDCEWAVNYTCNSIHACFLCRHNILLVADEVQTVATLLLLLLLLLLPAAAGPPACRNMIGIQADLLALLPAGVL